MITFAKLGSQLNKLMEEHEDVLSVNYRESKKRMEVQIYNESFKEYADGHAITEESRKDDKYPVKLSYTQEGVCFFAILTEQEYEDNFVEWLYPDVTDEEFVTSKIPSDEMAMKIANHSLKDF